MMMMNEVNTMTTKLFAYVVKKMQDLNETALPTPDLVWPIFGGNLDYFRYFTTQCAIFRTKKILAI